MVSKVILKKERRTVVLEKVTKEITRKTVYFDDKMISDSEILKPLEVKQAGLLATAFEIVESI